MGPPTTNLTPNSDTRFRVRAQRFLLTYSQLPEDFDRDGLGPHIKTCLDDEFLCITIGIEEHPNTGGYHAHCYVDTNRTFIINDPLFFDFDGVHPNIKPIRTTPHNARDYAIKDGEIIFDEGTPPELPSSKLSADDKWTTIMAAGSKDEFFKAAVKAAPRDTALHFNALQSFADWKYRDNPDAYESCEMICHCEKYPALTEWVQTNLRHPSPGRVKSLMMYGPSLLGKTLWARSLGKHAYFPGLFMLEGFNAKDSDYAIFDDLVDGLNSIPNFKFWLGAQAEFVVGDKYMRKQRIKWGKPAIFITNTDPRAGLSKPVIDWLEANCIFQEITETLSGPYIA